MKKLILGALLTMCLSVNAFAIEVPTDTVVQNLNGSQQVIKTFTIAPDVDAEELIEEPFVLGGYLYTFADITKEENHVEDTERRTQTVTVETDKDDLDVILEHLEPSLEYDDGQYTGTLALDHTSLFTEATGYSTKSYTVSETKTISQLDRNDMSYVPATTVKNGKTLSLSDVQWQVTGTDLVGEALMPSSYQAVATYSGKAYYNAANGYITTAEYVGDVTREGVESVTYTVTYLGAEVEEPDTPSMSKFADVWPYALGLLAVLAVLAAGTLTVLLMRSRREINHLREEQDDVPDEELSEQEDD